MVPASSIPTRLLLLALLLFALPLIQPARAQSASPGTLNYEHDLFGCDWLAKEYQRIIDRNKNQVQIKELGIAPLLAAPFILIEKMVGIEYVPPEGPPIEGTVSFSGSVEDIAIAADNKNCYQLYDRYIQGKSNGELDGVVPLPESLLPSNL